MKRGSPALVGGFIVGALALGTAAVVVLGSGRLFRTTVPFVAYFPGSVDGLDPGAPVKVRGLVVGSVRALYFNLSSKPRQAGDVRMPVVIDLEPKKFTARGVTLDFKDRELIDRFIRERGLRARLSTPSFITGGRYVALDLLPDTPAELVGDDTVAYQEIPTAPSDLDGVQKQALDVLDRLSRVDLEPVITSAQHVIDNANRVVTAPEVMATLVAIKQASENLRDATANLNGGITELRGVVRTLEPHATELARNLTVTSKAAGQLVDRAQALVDDAHHLLPATSPLITSAQHVLVELSDALRSVRQLADQLQRDPGAILRGTP